VIAPPQPAIKGVLFDVDGTLYHQTPVRAAMAAELGFLAARRPVEGRRVIAALRSFRRHREELRDRGHASDRLADMQFRAVAERLGEPSAFVERVVEEWMFVRPLKYVKAARRAEAIRLVRTLEARRIRLGVLSDYPALDKLEALGLKGSFEFALCTTDPDINAFKPHPRGSAYAASLFGLASEEVVYVGDRPEVDAAGADAAGMRCYLVGGAPRRWRDTGKDIDHGSCNLDDLRRICQAA